MSQNTPTIQTLDLQTSVRSRRPGLNPVAIRAAIPGATCFFAALVLMAGLWAGSAFAETSEAAKGYENTLDTPLSIELAEADVAETFASFAKVTGLQLSMHPAVEGKVTYAAQAEKLSVTIDGICRRLKLECYLLAGDPAILRVQPQIGFAGFPDNIDLELVEAPLDQILASFSVISEGRVQVSGSFEGQLSMSLKDQPWPEVLEHICAGHDCSVDWSSEPVTVTSTGQGR